MIQARYSCGLGHLTDIFNVVRMIGFIVYSEGKCCKRPHILDVSDFLSVSLFGSHSERLGIVITTLVSPLVSFCWYRVLHWWVILSVIICRSNNGIKSC
jgi:hypothetical protein